MTRVRPFLSLTVFALSQCLVLGQFCTSLNNNTWDGLVQAVVESSSNGFAVLCPFEISGERCPGQGDYPEGFRTTEQSDLFISCDPFLYGFNSDTECIINCPGRHFTVSDSSSLTLDRFILSGATTGSIQVESGGSLSVINSIFKDNENYDGNGGAINGLSKSETKIDYSQFLRNTGFHGGALFGGSESTAEVSRSEFEGNQAAVSGGAYASESFSNGRFENSTFSFNEASFGGALYVAEDADAEVLGSDFVSNVAINGGAIFNGGFSNVVDSTFDDNSAADSGGALSTEAGSTIVLTRNDFQNNQAGEYGPAVHNHLDNLVEATNNTACGNVVAEKKVQCDGVFVFLDGLPSQCERFSNACDMPSSQPSSSPAPSVMPSRIPSDMPSLVPSGSPSVLSPTIPSRIPSDLPSLVPSGMPSQPRRR